MTVLHTYAMPHTIGSDRLVIMAHLMPVPGPGNDWDAALTDWPGAVAATSFSLTVYDDKQVQAGSAYTQELAGEIVDRSAQTAAWQAIFNKSRMVLADPPPPPPGNREKRTFSYTVLANQHKRIYGALACQRLAAGLEAGVNRLLEASVEEVQEGARFSAFFQSELPSSPQSVAVMNKVYFQDGLQSSLRRHFVARKLALVEKFTLTVDMGKLPPQGFLELTAVAGPLSGGARAMRVAYDLKSVTDAAGGSGKLWFAQPRPRSENLRWGHASMNKAPLFVTELHDVESTQFKWAQWPRGVRAAATAPKPVLDAPAALRSYGFSFVEPGAQARADQADQRSSKFLGSAGAGASPAEDGVLYAEDLVVGYKFDVQRNGGTFRSLYEHNCSILVDGKQVLPSQRDETCTERVSTLAQKRDGTLAENTHEAIAHWDGWSLAVPKPVQLATVQSGVEAFTTKRATPRHSLPALRFGDSYRFAARAVFASGLSLTLDEARVLRERMGITDRISAPTRFTRTDVVRSPQVALAEQDDPDEKALIVGEVRSTAPNPKPVKRRVKRWFYPPACELPVCEMTGILEEKASSQAQFELLKDKLEGNGPDGNLVPPFLPDPWASAACVSIVLQTRSAAVLGGKSGGTEIILAEQEGKRWSTDVPFYGPGHAWPDYQRFSIECVAKADGPTIVRNVGDPSRPGRRIVIALAPADVVELQVGSRTGREKAQTFTLFSWAGQAAKLIGRAALSLDDARLGDGLTSHPMTTPAAILKCVHVVPAPLMPPAFKSPQIDKAQGDSLFSILDVIDVDSASSGTVEAQAEWVDVVDDTANPGPVTKRGMAVSSPVSLNPDQDEVPLTVGKMPLQMPDTKARRLKCSLVAHPRHTDVYPEAGKTQRRSEGLDLIVPNSGVPAACVPRYVLPLFQWSREYKPGQSAKSFRDATQFRIYLQRPMHATGFGELVGLVCWPDAAADLTPQNRELLRPFVSQWGEDPLFDGPHLAKGPFSHQFLSHSNARQVALRELFSAEDLEKAGKAFEGPEWTGRRVSVIGYEPQYDAIKRLWFIDVAMKNQPAYLPWIKLAIVRFQPNSLAGCEVSHVSPATFVQLQPDRTLTITRSRVDDRLFQLAVSGVSGSAGASISPPRVTVQLQERIWKFSDLAWQGVGATLTMKREGGLDAGGAWLASMRIPQGDLSCFRLEVREILPVMQDHAHVYEPAVRTAYGERLIYLEHVPLNLVS